jgi:uncharacterized protein
VRREDITFFSGGLKCSGWFYPADRADSDPPAPGVVFCPGYTGSKFAAFYQPYVERFVAAGIAVALIDYRGWGESEGPRGVIDPRWQVADIRSALTYLETRSDVDSDALGVIGVSFGGGNAIQVAGIDQRVKAVVSVSGIADGEAFLRSTRREHEWGEFLDRLDRYRRDLVLTGTQEMVAPMGDIAIPTPERRATQVKGNVPAGMTPEATPLECADAIIDFRPLDVAGRISPRAALWICVDGDVVVPPEHSESMFDAAGSPKRLVRLSGSTHYAAYLDHLDRIAEESIAWFGQWLRPSDSVEVLG